MSEVDDKHRSFAAHAIVILLVAIPIVSAIAYGAVDALALGALFILATVIVLLRVVDGLRSGSFEYSSEAIQLPLIALILITSIQLLPLAGSDPTIPALDVPPSRVLSADPYGTRFFLLHLIVYFVFLSTALVYVTGRRRTTWISLSIIVFGTALAFFGILQRLSVPDAIYGLRETPQAIPFGPFVNQHHFAALMLMTSGVTLGLLFGSGTRRERKIFLALAAGIMGIAIMFTGSRGGMIGFLSVVGLAAVASFAGRGEKVRDEDERIERRNRNLLVIGAAAGLIVLVLGSVLLLGGQESLLRGMGLQYSQDDVYSGRLHFWSIAWQIFLQHPILGAGMNGFGVSFSQFDTWKGMYRVENAHNDYLQILADGGILGFACVAVFLFLLFRRGIANLRDHSDGLRRSIVVGALAGCTGILIHSAFDFPLRTPANALMFLLLITLAVSNSFSSRKQRSL